MEPLRGTQWLSIDLTHDCNLSCPWCGKLCPDDYEMSMMQLTKVIDYFSDNHVTIRVSGGEPMIHPYAKEALILLSNSFGRVFVATNGTFPLPRIPNVHYLISHYPGVNDYEVAQYHAIHHVIDNIEFYDPYHDPDLDIETALEVYHKCHYVQMKVIGDNVYGCCHAETVQRVHGGELGVKLNDRWEEALGELERWQACRHCFMAERRMYAHTG
jgi:organic radical activating enzyme